MHQWSPLDFNLTLNCLDSYIAPKLKQRGWRPQRFVCPLKPCGRPPRLPPTTVASRAKFSLRSFFSFSGRILLPSDFFNVREPGFDFHRRSIRLTIVYRRLVAICIIEFKKSVCGTIDLNTSHGTVSDLQCALCFVCLQRQRNHMLLKQWGYQVNSLLCLVAEGPVHANNCSQNEQIHFREPPR